MPEQTARVGKVKKALKYLVNVGLCKAQDGDEPEETGGGGECQSSKAPQKSANFTNGEAATQSPWVLVAASLDF